MVSCDLPNADPATCFEPCDPSIEECPVEEKPYGPSYDDFEIVGEYIATKFQVFVANLQVLTGVLLFLIAQLVITFRMNKSVSYTQMQVDYNLMAGQSNWWTRANSIRNFTTISILSVAFVT